MSEELSRSLRPRHITLSAQPGAGERGAEAIEERPRQVIDLLGTSSILLPLDAGGQGPSQNSDPDG